MLLIRPFAPVPPPAGPGARPDGILHWHWARSTDGQRIDGQGQTPTAELDRLTVDGACILVVPLTWLSWHRIRLPGGRAARTPAVIASLLEDAVLDDPATLHAALEPRGGRGDGAREVWVAVCRRDALHAALEPLLRRGWPVRAIVPELAPSPQRFAWVHLVDDAPHLTLAGPDGILSQPLGPTPGGLSTDAAAELAWAEPAALRDAERLAPGHPWVVAPAGQVWLRTLAGGWNLAQFDLRARVGGVWWHRLAQWGHAAWHAPAWRPARWGAVALVGMPLLALPGLAWQSHRHEQALQAALVQAARQALPDTPVLLDPVRQVRQAIDRERVRTGTVPPHAVERLLHAWGESPDLPALQSLVLDGRQIRVQTEAPVAVGRLAAVLAPRGWTVTGDGERRWTLVDTGGEQP